MPRRVGIMQDCVLLTNAVSLISVHFLRICEIELKLKPCCGYGVQYRVLFPQVHVKF